MIRKTIITLLILALPLFLLFVPMACDTGTGGGGGGDGDTVEATYTLSGVVTYTDELPQGAAIYVVAVRQSRQVQSWVLSGERSDPLTTTPSAAFSFDLEGGDYYLLTYLDLDDDGFLDSGEVYQIYDGKEEGENPTQINLNEDITDIIIDFTENFLFATNVATPQFDPPAGTYEEDIEVTISCETEGAVIYYTTDGLEPDDTATVFEALLPIPIAGDGTTMTIMAVAVKDQMSASEVATADYVIDYNRVSTPQFDPAPGTYSADIEVAISCQTEDATIYYTTDGTDPDITSPVYADAPIAIEGDGSTMTIKAFAVYGDLNDSTIAVGDYVIQYVGEILLKDSELVEYESGDTFDFGSGSGSWTMMFTITNTGDGDLNLVGDPDYVQITPNDHFTVEAQPASPIEPSGGTTTFTVQFASAEPYGTPVAAQIFIPNDDPDEGDFYLVLTGTPEYGELR